MKLQTVHEARYAANHPALEFIASVPHGKEKSITFPLAAVGKISEMISDRYGKPVYQGFLNPTGKDTEAQPYWSWEAPDYVEIVDYH